MNAQKDSRLAAQAAAAYHSFFPFPTVYSHILPFPGKKERKGMVNTILIGASTWHPPMSILKGIWSQLSKRASITLHENFKKSDANAVIPVLKEVFNSAFHPYPAKGKAEAAHTATKTDPDDKCY